MNTEKQVLFLFCPTPRHGSSPGAKHSEGQYRIYCLHWSNSAHFSSGTNGSSISTSLLLNQKIEMSISKTLFWPFVVITLITSRRLRASNCKLVLRILCKSLMWCGSCSSLSRCTYILRLGCERQRITLLFPFQRNNERMLSKSFNPNGDLGEVMKDMASRNPRAWVGAHGEMLRIHQ